MGMICFFSLYQNSKDFSLFNDGVLSTNNFIDGNQERYFLKYGGFLSGKNWGEDHELWCRIALREPVAYCSTRSAIWHWDSENRLGNISPPVELEPVYFTVKNALSQGIARTENFRDIYEYLAKKEIEYAIRLLKAGKPKTALSVLLRCKTKRHYYLKINHLLPLST